MPIDLFAHLDLGTLAFLVAAAAFAGWIDAVVGGGGLIQLPALLIALPGAAPIQVLATNKLASICGTATSAATYTRRLGVETSTVIPLAVGALAGSAAGAAVAGLVPKAAFDPIILAALLCVGAYTVLRPDLGSVAGRRLASRRNTATVAAIGVGVGFYDGALGPGTGSFFVIALVALAGHTFLSGSAHAKIANVATNFAALAVFIPQGAVLWGLGLAMAAANMCGGYLGARTAVTRGSTFVRMVFVVVIVALAVRIAWGIVTR